MLNSRGFTLVEMLVALALFSLLLAAVAPNLLSAQQARQQTADLKLLETRLKTMGLRAVLSNSPLEIYSHLLPHTPTGLTLQVQPKLAYFDAQGFCNAEFVAIYKDQTLLKRWNTTPPYCTTSL